ncbi:hypothetical protein LOTGIDRAFT_196719 [Lottia gigantea]|uniref:EF-hand domain-containing protein n=1 Tax=Lottia gigantea TaxID=225164 RepID=V4B6X7_LOTGI|nr:hypothetical protein LOTGIDRAFT_196719 [Lottia gigantea]ESO84304.1 hypothetical protein LOTGIDRAFT_196719 [Lottia gigantea]
MPMKKKGKGKKKGKKGTKESAASQKVNRDPLKPEAVAQPILPREKLVNLLTSNPVDEKEVHGFKVSTRVLNELTPQEIRDLRVVFDLFDINNDGLIGAAELRRSLKALGFKVSKADAHKLIADSSNKGSSLINFTEFLETVIDRQGDTRDVYDEIIKGFQMFDLEKTGSISLDNLIKICQETGLKFTKKDLEEMIVEADVNGDGLIDQNEFIRIMLQTNLF